MICLPPPPFADRYWTGRSRLRWWLALGLIALAALAVPRPAAADEPSWSPLGPALVLDADTWGDRAPATGRVNVIVPNPENPLGDIWVGAAGGGAWNGSVYPEVHWRPMTDDQPSLAIGAIALDSCNSDRCLTVWVGTGENAGGRDTQYGHGVLLGTFNASTKTYDWVQLGADRLGHANVTRLLLDPESVDGPKKHLYVALAAGVSANATHSTVPVAPASRLGIWRSLDGGQNWDNVLDTDDSATDLELDPLDPQTLYASFVSKGIFRSTDGGEHWETIVKGIPDPLYQNAAWTELAATLDDGTGKTRLYLALGACPPPHLHDGQPAYCSPDLYSSGDGGDSWDLLYHAAGLPAMGAPLTAHLASTHALLVHPKTSSELWFGGINLYHSSDGGQSWSTIGAAELHPNHHALAVVATAEMQNGYLFYDGSDGGLFLGDGDGLWNGTFQHGLAIGLGQSLAVRGRRLMSGHQGSGGDLSLGAEVWQHASGRTGGAVLFDPDSSSRSYATGVGVGPLRCAGPDACLDDWQPIAGNQGLPDALAVSGETSWFAPFVQAASGVPDHHALFFAAQGLWRNTVAGGLPQSAPGWLRITPSGLGGGAPIPELGGIANPITAIAVAPSLASRVYIGFYDGQLFTTVDGLGTNPVWVPADTGLPARPLTALAVLPNDPLTVLAAFSGFGSHSIYLSTNAGLSWVPFDDSWDGLLAQGPVNALLITAGVAPQVWAGTDQGAYVRSGLNPAAGAFSKSPGLPNAAVYALADDLPSGNVYASTHGRGSFVFGLAPRLQAERDDCCFTGGSYQANTFVGVSGAGFRPDESCTMTLWSGLTLCGSANIGLDATGAELYSDDRGYLASAMLPNFEDRQLVWACAYGQCAGGLSYDACPVDKVKVSCGQRQSTVPVAQPVQVVNVGSTRLTVKPNGSSGTIIVRPIAARTTGTSTIFCEVGVPFTGSQSAATVLANVAATINGSSSCSAGGLTARVVGPASAPVKEGDEPLSPYLVLAAPSQSAVQLVTAVRVQGAIAAGVLGFGDLAHGSRVVPSIRLSGTPAGGRLHLEVLTTVGVRAVNITIEAGQGLSQVITQVFDGLTGRDTGGGLPVGGTGGPPRGTFTVMVTGTAVHLPHTVGVVIQNSDPGLHVDLEGM